ncbi:MAG: hypothetical protein JJ714_00100 [Acidithiobacillus sp.]|nr:hypothetical protein [Acidithiobacillus sp.]
MTVIPQRGVRAETTLSWVWFLVPLGWLFTAYFVLRYGGLWMENDTAVFSQVGTLTVHAATLFFPGQYTHGYGYPGLLAGYSFLTGISSPILNTVVMPYLGTLWFMVAGYLAYRTLLHSELGAATAMLITFAVPDLWFSVLRGNHEKLNLMFLLMTTYVLFKGFLAMEERDAKSFAIWVGIFYVVALTNAGANDYFASTMAVGLAFTVVLVSWFLKRSHNSQAIALPALRRFGGAVMTSWLLVWWVMLFVFPPAGHDFALLTTVADKLRSLFLTFRTGSNPYTLAASQWAGPLAHAATAAFRWVLFLGSLLVWIRVFWTMVRQRTVLPLSEMVLMGWYGAFGLLIAVAIPVDFTGLSAGSNLEVRNYTDFTLMAAPMLAAALVPSAFVGITGISRVRSILARPWASWAGGGALVLFIAIGLLKVTLDPLVSNDWMVYRPSERQALSYFWHHSRGTILWTGPDNRLVNVATAWFTINPGDNQMVGYSMKQAYRDWLRSPLIVANLVTDENAIPDYRPQNRVYDNGFAQVYRQRPKTPFEN